MADIKNYGLIGVASNVQLGKNGGYIDYTGGSFSLTKNLGEDGDLFVGNITASNTVEFGNLSDGAISITGFIDDDTMASASATTLATSESIKAYVDSQITAGDLDFQGDLGGLSNVTLSDETFTVAGGDNITTTGSGTTLTIDLDQDIVLNSVEANTLQFNSGLTDGTLTMTQFDNDPLLSANSASRIATQQAVKTYVDNANVEVTEFIETQVGNVDLDYAGDTGGTLSVNLSTEIFTVAGGTNINTAGAGQTLTVNLDDNVTLAGNIDAVNGTFSGDVTATGTVQGGTLTDGTLTISGGEITGATGNITTTGIVEGGTITDGTATLTGGDLTTTGNVTASDVAFDTLTDTGEAITITKFVDEADGIANNDNDTTIPTSAAVKDYVDNNITAQDLDFAGDSGTGNVDLDSQTFTVAGGTNLTTSATNQTLTIDLDDDIVLAGNITAVNGTFSGAVDATGDVTSLGTVEGATLTDGTATLTGGDFSTTGNVNAADGTFTGTVDGATLTDGTATLTGGDFSGLGTVTATSFTDGTATLTGGDLTTTGTVDAGTVEFDSLSGTGAITVTDILDDDTFATASNTTLATSESIKEYVDSQLGGADLSVAGDSGTGEINLATETFSILGTTNEIETVFDGVDSLTVGLPDEVTVTTKLSVPEICTTLISCETGGTTLDGNITISGNLTVQGDQIIVQSTVTAYEDPVIYLQSNTLVSNSGLDVGIHFNYWDTNANAQDEGFFGWDQSTGKYVFETGVTESPLNVFAGNVATVVANIEGDISGATGTFTGTVEFGTLSDGTINIEGFIDDDTMATASNTTLATSESVKAYVDAMDLDFQGDAGGALDVNLLTQTFTIAGGTNITTTGSGETLTVDLDDDVTLAGNLTTVNGTFSGDADVTGTVTGGTLTDGTASITGGDFTTTGNVSAADGTFTGAVGVTGDVAFGTLTDTAESITISKFVDEADGIVNNDNDTTLPTTAAVIDYVTNGPVSPDGLLIRGAFTANSTDSTFNVGPVPNTSGRTYYADKVVVKVTSAFAGDSFSHIAIAENAGSGAVLVAADDADGAVVGTYVVDLTGTETLTAGQNVQVQFLQGDGTTPAVVTSGAVTVSVHYNWV